MKPHKIKAIAVNTGYNGFTGLVNLNQKILYLPPFGHNMDTVLIMVMRGGGKLNNTHNQTIIIYRLLP